VAIGSLSMSLDGDHCSKRFRAATVAALSSKECEMKAIAVRGLALVVLVVAVGLTPAQPPAKKFTKVVLTELDCMGCAKKIAGKVTKVTGVELMRVDLDARTIFAVHKDNMTPSPKAIWEAIEQADHTPEKMETPTATHKTKPTS
jgi:copper chaperone CopZ